MYIPNHGNQPCLKIHGRNSKNRFCHVNQRNRTGFTQWLQAERRRAPLSACCLAYATGRRGSQGLAGPWALSKGKLLEGKKKYRGSMMPAAKRAKPLYLLEELWHPGTSVFERPESLERLLQQARSATEGAIRGQLCWNADVTEKSKAVVPRVSGAEGQSLLSAREYME